MKHRILIAISAALALSGMTTAALALTGAHTTRDVIQVPGTQAKATATTVGSRLSTNLRIFRRPQSSMDMADGITSGTREAFSHIGKFAGANLQLARMAKTPTGPFYIIPGNGQVCEIGPGGMACGDTSELASHPEAYLTISGSLANPPHTILVSGIAPDSVERITAVRADGSTLPVPVSDNAYASLLPDDTTYLQFATTQGTVGTKLSAPPR